MSKYFGTDGIRGKANTGMMTPANILKVGQAIGVFLKQKYNEPKVIIGKDTRVSGYMVEGVLMAGLASVGVKVFYVGPIPTPGVAYLTRGMRADAGIMISASHNPFHDNGIKIFDQDGYKLPDEQEEEIEALVDSPSLEDYLAKPDEIGRAKRIDDAIGQYAVFLKERFPNDLKLDGMRIVLDCANGASYKVAPKVFKELGAEVFCIHDTPDGFNINRGSGALHPEKLCTEVKKYRANVGFAFDGDADRLIAVDDNGQQLDGDQLIAICANYMKEQKQLQNNRVCVTVMSNKGFDVAMEKAGIEVVRTKVGDRYVMEALRQNAAILGGEQSGHLLFLDSNTTGDGVLAALKLLEVMIRKNQSLSQLANIMKKYPQVLLNQKITHKPPLEKLPNFLDTKRTQEEILGNKGRVLVRYSGTEPLARITVEGESLQQIEDMARQIADSLESDISNFLNSSKQA